MPPTHHTCQCSLSRSPIVSLTIHLERAVLVDSELPPKLRTRQDAIFCPDTAAPGADLHVCIPVVEICHRPRGDLFRRETSFQ